MPTITFSANGTSSSIKFNRRTSGHPDITCHAYGTFDTGTLTPEFSIKDVSANFDTIADATALTADGHFGLTLDSGFYRFVLAGGAGSEAVTVDCSQGTVV